MSEVRDRLVPHMPQYTFWLPDQPYVMWFQEGEEKSEVHRTDADGFRLSVRGEEVASVATWDGPGPVRLLAGSSAAYGVGASSDAATISSRLWAEHAPSTPWFNFAGQAFNSTQELLLLALFHHRLPPVSEIVLCSGVNNLVLARVPAEDHGAHGAYFSCEIGDADEAPSVEERSERAASRTADHLATWKALAGGMGASLTFALQPLAPWVRAEPAAEEAEIFADLDTISNFRGLHNDIADMAVGRRYADELAAHCARLDVGFLDTNPALAARATAQDWLFVDRVHLLDRGQDLLARVIAEELALR